MDVIGRYIELAQKLYPKSDGELLELARQIDLQAGAGEETRSINANNVLIRAGYLETTPSHLHCTLETLTKHLLGLRDSLALDAAGMMDLVKRFPPIAGFNPAEGEGLDDKAKWWGGKEVFIDLVKRFPPIAGYSLESRVIPRLLYLQELCKVRMVPRDVTTDAARLAELIESLRAGRLDKEETADLAAYSRMVLIPNDERFIHTTQMRLGLDAFIEDYARFRDERIVPRFIYLRSLGEKQTSKFYGLLSKDNSQFIEALRADGLEADMPTYNGMLTEIKSKLDYARSLGVKVGYRAHKSLEKGTDAFIAVLRTDNKNASMEGYSAFVAASDSAASALRAAARAATPATLPVNKVR